MRIELTKDEKGNVHSREISAPSPPAAGTAKGPAEKGEAPSDVHRDWRVILLVLLPILLLLAKKPLSHCFGDPASAEKSLMWIALAFIIPVALIGVLTLVFGLMEETLKSFKSVAEPVKAHRVPILLVLTAATVGGYLSFGIPSAYVAGPLWALLLIFLFVLK